MWAEAMDHYVTVAATTSWADSSNNDELHRAPAPDHMQRMRAPLCPSGTLSSGDPLPCPGDPVVPLPECGDAATLPDLWERPEPDGLPGPWQLIGPPVCATPADVTPAMVLTAFRRLPLAPSALVVQPDRGWLLVNKPTVVHADPTAQRLTTTILGTAVTITATPTRYAWDFGDGGTLTTADPGLPWPAGTLTHTYAHVASYRITLTTTWSATYTLAGDPAVRDVPGTATTTTSTAPLVVQERRSHLVGTTCAEDPAAAGC